MELKGSKTEQNLWAAFAGESQASAISQKVCRIVDAVRTHSGFAWRSQMLAVESFMY